MFAVAQSHHRAKLARDQCRPAPQHDARRRAINASAGSTRLLQVDSLWAFTALIGFGLE
jgi:hypothetical protein